ncbi:MAG: MFS transporter [Anaerolineales bacterium]
MFLKKQTQRVINIYHEYPRAFWMVVLVNFIDHLGTSLLLPFFALYMTKRFDVGMETVGALFAVWTSSSFIGSFPGGALTDRLGRKGMIIVGLVATSLSHLALGIANTLTLFFSFGFVAGIFTDIATPAYQAIVADLLPEQKRSQGYGIVRVAFNLSAALGPAIGGFIATRSYLVLFIAGAAVSLIAAVVVFIIVPETKPQSQPSVPEETTAESFGGYLRILRDAPFMVFTAISVLAWLVYINMSTTLGVFLKSAHGIPETGYGWLLSLNAVLVVLFQFPITRHLEKRPPMTMMAIGAALLGIGFAMYGFFSTYALFLAAMLVITVGEMIMMPISNALVVKFAPEDMRGRYSFMYNISWGIAYAAGPYLAGVIMDNTNPNWLWFACGILGMAAALGFLYLHGRLHRSVLSEKG